MQLIDDVLRRRRGRDVPVKPLRVGTGQVHRHAAQAVAPAGRGVGVGGTGGPALHRYLKVVVDAVEAALQRQLPYPLVPRRQRPVVLGRGGVVGVQIQLHPGRLGAPQLEHRPVLGAGAPQVAALVGVPAVKFLVVMCPVAHTHSP